MAKPTRFGYGIALGWENQFNAYGKGMAGMQNTVLLAGQQPAAGVLTSGLLAQASTGPDTSMGSLFYTNNTGATVISLFRHYVLGKTGEATLSAGAQGLRPAHPPEGKLIRVMFLDNNTSYAQGGSGGIGNIVLTSSDNGAGINTICDFMASNGTWYQVGLPWRPNINMGITSFAGAGSISFNATTASLIVAAITGATQLVSISGGQVGQELTFFNNTGGVTLTISTNGNILIAGTNAVVLRQNDTYWFTKVATNTWSLSRSNL